LQPVGEEVCMAVIPILVCDLVGDTDRLPLQDVAASHNINDFNFFVYKNKKKRFRKNLFLVLEARIG
jgi:hypothetical protein